jgi:hypothetical protein
MRKALVLLVLLPLSAGCVDLDLTGLGDALVAGLCGGSCPPPPPPTLAVMGRVQVGPYPAATDEAKVLVYAASDTIMPTDSASGFGSYYWFDFGANPVPAVCGYLARAVKWSGETTELKPLFVPGESCEVSPGARQGSDFELPDYAPLDQPFVVWGNVRVDGRTPTAGEVVVKLHLRGTDDGAWPEVEVPTDDEGVFRYETTEGAQRYEFCVDAGASVQRAGGGDPVYSGLGPSSGGECHDERQVPDVRIGTRKAASGWIFTSQSDAWLPRDMVGAGAARVALLDPADSTIVGEEVETYDDGSFHVWFPHDMQDPGCDWLVRAELVETGEAKVQPLSANGTACYPDMYLQFEFDQ